MGKNGLFIILLALFANNFLHNFLAVVIRFLQNTCIEASPLHSPYSSIYLGLVCNQNPKPSEFFVDLKKTGLFHLLIISGSHLLFIEKVLGLFTKFLGAHGSILSFLIVTTYSLMCGFSPPVTRCWLNLSLKSALKQEAVSVHPVYSTFYSGLLTLALFPHWLHSASFLLSWCASLFVTYHTKNGVIKHFVIYLGLLPVFYAFQVNSPLTALINWALAPLIGFILLPACILTFVLPPLQPLTDCMIDLLAKVLRSLSLEIHQPAPSTNRWVYLACWAYLLLAHIFVHKLSVASRRKELTD